MADLIGENWLAFLIALAIGIVVAWWVFAASRRTRIERAQSASPGEDVPARRNQALIDAPLSAAGVRIDGLVPVLDTRQLIAMRAFMTDRIKDVGIQAANKINTELGLVVLGAQPQTNAVTRVTAILGETSRARAITIVRTELSRVYGTASQERLTQAVAVVPGLKKQWRRSGKVHSRITHDLADGTVVDVGQPFRLGNGVKLMYPHDPNADFSEVAGCQCYRFNWVKRWGEIPEAA